MTSILPKPFSILDEEILREHSKITKKWEDKGFSRYSLSNLINVSSSIIKIMSGNPYPISFFFGWNLAADNFTKPYGEDFNVQESSSRVERGNPIIKKFDRVTRLPLILTGIGMAGYGLCEIVSGLYNNENQNISDGLTHISYGMPFIGAASCQYVKDADPKLLDKDSLFKRAYNGLKEKLSLPQIEPARAPATNYSTIDDRLEN